MLLWGFVVILGLVSLRKKPTFRVPINGFPSKWRLRNERRNSIVMTCHYHDLGSAADWLKQISLAQRAKKVVSDSPLLVDFAIGLVNSVLNLPDGQLKFFEEFKLQKNCEINSVHQNVLGASWNDVWASICYLQLARMASFKNDFLCTPLATPPMAEVLVDLRSDASSVWNFCACYTGKPLLENQWLRREMLAVFCKS